MTREEILHLLAETPTRIEAMTGGLEPSQLQEAPESGGWSANLVLAHLRCCADVWAGCIRAIVADDHPTLRAMNPRTWARRTDYSALDFVTSWQAYIKQREQLLRDLEQLPSAAWSRTAAVIGAGAVLERTVQFYAEWLATHERSHLRQFQRLAANQRQR